MPTTTSAQMPTKRPVSKRRKYASSAVGRAKARLTDAIARSAEEDRTGSDARATHLGIFILAITFASPQRCMPESYVTFDANEFLATTRFYQSGGAGNNSVSPTQQNLSKLFDKYRGKSYFSANHPELTANPDQPKDQPDRIGIDGAQKYLNDLRVGLEELTHLALCELLQSPSIGEFTRDKFITGWRSLERISQNQSSDTIKVQADYVKTMRKKLQSDRDYLKQVYRYTFTLARPEGQKNIPVDAALDFWKMFFDSDKGGTEWNSDSTPWLDWWLEYYETQYKRPANKDLWNMVGELVNKTKEPGGENMDWWSEDGAWPMAVDEFVSFVKEKRGDVVMDTSS